MSMKFVVITFLSIVAIILGLTLAIRTTEVAEVLDQLPAPANPLLMAVEVNPQSSQEGTSFFIRARLQEQREQQDITLDLTSEGYLNSMKLYDDGNHFDEESNDGIYGGYFDSTDQPLGTYEISKEGKTLSNFLIYQPGCEPIFGEGAENKINFLFVPSGYDNYEEFKSDSLNLISGRNSFLEEEPFSYKQNRISISIVNTTQEISCLTGCKGIDAAVCCNTDVVLTQAAQCNYDSIVVLVNEDDYCGSASSYSKVCAKHEDAKKILMHELGHSFAGLADEYNYQEVYENYNIGPVDAPNCAPKNCEKWDSVTGECFQGCTYSDLYRSVKGNSIMYDLYPEYNLISKNHISNLIDNSISKKIEVDFLSPPQKSYFINLEYDNGNIEFENIYLKPIRSEISMLSSDYKIKIKNSIGKTIYTSNISVPNIIYPLPDTPSVPMMQENFSFPLLVPYIPEGGKLEILWADQIISQIDLSIFSESCGNNICEEGENNLNCISDCPIERDNFCQRDRCDPDCPSQTNCVQKKENLDRFQLALAIIFVVGILGLMISEKSKKKRK